ncbi:hypothetical protein [Luteolibacter marinus]|uniref:hypothetical protein n=1 Tax=Luteolibacter marinus TaxID=2776705 RepID=UPI001867AFAC|nr:hypothetical protein [Luteolibacter marinus]
MAAFLTLLGGLDLSGIIDVLPAKVATGLATALQLLAGLVHLVKAVGDFVDDGQINGSFKALGWLLVLGFAVMSMSCAGMTSAITGQPIHSTVVQREGGKPFNLATQDVLRAESSPPETVFGLYDAGLVARRATEVLKTGK